MDQLHQNRSAEDEEFKLPARYLYTGEAGTLWEKFADESYRSIFKAIPLAEVTETAYHSVDHAPLSLTWLGAGSGWYEQYLSEGFAKTGRVSALTIHEIVPEKAAATSDVFRCVFPDTEVRSISGEVETLELRLGRGAQLVGLMGGTLSNLPARQTLRWIAAQLRDGDLFLLDFSFPRANDGRLTRPITDAEMQVMISALNAYTTERDGEAPGPVLSKQSLIPGGYAFTYHSLFEARSIEILSIARYSANHIRALATAAGLQLCGEWSYGLMACQLYKKS